MKANRRCIVSIMPRIPQMYLDCVVYLYPTKEMAEEGVPTGGTGFIVGLQRGAKIEFCVVSNAHVAVKGRCNFMRYNHGVSSEVVEIQSFKWVQHRHADDVAAARFDPLDRDNTPYVHLDAFITPQFMEDFGVRPGIDAFMIGRLVGRDGKQQNKPSLRFGHLAMMNDGVLRGDGSKQESFLVELWSLAGYSGSPDFIYESMDRLPGDRDFRFFDSRLLGINWGCYQRKERVFAGKQGKPVETGLWNNSNSGFACVVPAWKVTELLQEDELWQ